MHGVLLNAIVRDGAYSRDLAPAALEAKKRAAQQAAEAAAAAAAAPPPSAPTSPPAPAGGQADDMSSDISDLDDLDESPEKRVLDAAHAAGRGWEKKLLHADDHRAGWENHLVGCLASVRTPMSH